MSVNIKNNIWWVGRTDWELRKFHGNEYSTDRGTTYNSYLNEIPRSSSLAQKAEGIPKCQG